MDMASPVESEFLTKSVMDLTEYFNQRSDDEFPLASATAMFLKMNDDKYMTKGASKSLDFLNTDSRFARNVEKLLSDNSEGVTARNLTNAMREETKRPSSMATALSLLHSRHGPRLRHKHDYDKDYDDAWPHSPLIQCSRLYCAPVNCRIAAKVADLRGEFQANSRSYDESPLLGNEYEVPLIDIAPQKPHNVRTSAFYADPEKLNVYEAAVLANEATYGSLASLEVKSGDYLPKNALLQYFGKTIVTSEETTKLNFARTIRQLTSSSDPNDASFVLMRIHEEVLILEARLSAEEEKTEKSPKPFSKLRKRLSMEKKKRDKSPGGHVFRKNSSPALWAPTKKPDKKSVINIREAEVEVGIYNEIGGDFTPGTKPPKRSELCMDIFLCMGCRSGSGEYEASVVEDDTTSSTKTATLSTPIRGNKIVDSFPLTSIVYCGTEYAKRIDAYFIVWLHHGEISGEQTTECHVAACDDIEHARLLATSLAKAIRNAV